MAYNGYGGYNSYPYTYVNPYQSPVQPYGQPSMPQMQQAQSQPSQQAQQPVQSQNQSIMPPKSNMIFVTSAEDALNRYAEFNTDIVYYHQDQPFGFQVKTDMQGKKSIQPFKMIPCTLEEMQAEIQGVTKAQMADYVTQEQFNKRMIAMENKIDALTKSALNENIE